MPRSKLSKPRTQRSATYPNQNKTWSQEDLLTLEEMVSEHSRYGTIARALGRTASAVLSRANQLRLNPRHQNGMTVYRLARLFSTLDTVVTRWIDSDHLLRAQSINKRERMVSDIAILAFIDDPETWIVWNVDDITDDALREYARDRRGDIVWYRASEAAKRIGYTNEGLREQRLYHGLVGRFFHANWWYRSDVLGAWLASRPDRREPVRRPRLTASELAFMRDWRPFQAPIHLAAALERPPSTIGLACRRLGLAGPFEDPIAASLRARARLRNASFSEDDAP